MTEIILALVALGALGFAAYKEKVNSVIIQDLTLKLMSRSTPDFLAAQTILRPDDVAKKSILNNSEELIPLDQSEVWDDPEKLTAAIRGEADGAKVSGE